MRRFCDPGQMPVSTPLPAPLSHSAFSTNRAAEEGVGPGRLRGGDLHHPHHGVHVLRELLEDSHPALDTMGLSQATRAALVASQNYLPVMKSSQHFSHVTAAHLWGCPLPRRFDRVPLDVTGARAPRFAGVTGHTSLRLAEARRFGLPVVDPVTLFCQLAALVGHGLSHDDLVAVGDHLVVTPHVADRWNPRPLTTLSALESGVAGFRGRGSRPATSAVRLVRACADDGLPRGPSRRRHSS